MTNALVDGTEDESAEGRSDTLDPGDEKASWLDDASQEPEEMAIDEYDIVSAPNDWNFLTIVSFIESGSVKIPPFQRNYVWDIKRASKLIESLLLGLPVPQVFLYEEDRNSFLVIDGQQRLLTLYFYKNGRFPKPGSRTAVRNLLSSGGTPSADVLHSDEHFVPFKLSLPKRPNGQPSHFSKMTYLGLGDYKTTLDLRTIRNVVVKQTRPTGHSSIFEIFSRLNTGGMNLSPQEIRGSLYHSELMSLIQDLNMDPDWRRLLGSPQPDSRMRDTELILRSMALARGLSQYSASGSMAGFVNAFCLQAQKFTPEQAQSAVEDFARFLSYFATAPTDVFTSRQGKFSGVLFESLYAAWVQTGRPDFHVADVLSRLSAVKYGDAFAATLVEGSTKTINVRARADLANGILSPEVDREED